MTNPPFVLLSVASGYWIERIAQGMIDECLVRRIPLNWLNLNEFRIRRIQGGRNRGVAVFGNAQSVPALLRECGGEIPVINLQGDVADARVPTIMPDNVLIGRTVAEHLLAEGVREFLFVGPPSNSQVRLKARGFFGALKRRGVKVHRFDPGAGEKFWGSDFGRGRRFLRTLRRIRPPVGIFAVNDRIAASCIECVRLLDWKVPKDAAIVGVEDHPVFANLHIPLTSFRIDLQEIGRKAVEVLLDLENTGHSVAVSYVGGELVVRESSRLRLIRDSKIAAVVEYIDAHYRGPFQLSALANQFGMSRASFTSRFRRATGESILQYAIRRRVECARQLLANSDLSISEVAQTAGFESTAYFARIFKSRTGLTPTDCRTLHAPEARPGTSEAELSCEVNGLRRSKERPER